jgi:hypothetical protein
LVTSLTSKVRLEPGWSTSIRREEDYIVIRYSWVAGSLPSEKNSNLQFSKGFPLFTLLLAVPICPLLGRPIFASAQFSGLGIEARMAGSFLLFLAETGGSC